MHCYDCTCCCCCAYTTKENDDEEPILISVINVITTRAKVLLPNFCDIALALVIKRISLYSASLKVVKSSLYIVVTVLAILGFVTTTQQIRYK